MRRRRFKPRVAWLPVLGSAGGIENFDPIFGMRGSLNFDIDQITWDAQPVTFDSQASAEVVQGGQVLGTYPKTLQDLVSGSSYRLRRIVGKAHIGVAGATGTATDLTRLPFVEVAAGFIICKTDDDGTPTTDFNFVNPLAQDSAEDPWIWHRKWIFGTTPDYTTWVNPSINNGIYSYSGNWPSNTSEYGSVADGPHIDQKTGRNVGPSERLMHVIAARGWDPVGMDTELASGSIVYNTSVRLVGSLRKSGGNRRNASR